MTNRDFLRNLVDQISTHIATLPRPESIPGALRDTEHVINAIEEVRNELDAIDVQQIEEAAQVKPLHDRLHAVVIHCRVLRNNLDRIELATELALDVCRQLSAAVEEPELIDDDL